MKQEIKIGDVVDDGTGDYLRKGGIKINDNFNELYWELGDGENPHSAGAWKTYKTVDSANITADFGKSYVLDSEGGRMTVNLPKGTSADYNNVIRLRDVFGSWQRNPITVIAAGGDTLKGSSAPKEFNTQFQDLEMVYCPPGRWEYVENKQINKITSGDLAAVVRREYLIEAQDQTDFLDIFDGHDYNSANLEIFHRGNILYYGADFSDNSDYGSPGATAGDIIPLNGRDIRLRQKCNVGDTVIIVSYLDGLTQWRSTYNRRQIVLLDSSKTSEVSVPGQTYVGDIKNLKEFTTEMFGLSEHEPINPNSLEVEFNGILQAQYGSLNTSAHLGMYCKGFDADTEAGCILLGGEWLPNVMDYDIFTDSNSRVLSITTNREMSHGDVVMIRWFNNNIGTTLELDEILDATDDVYLSKGQPLDITGAIRYTDETNPAVPNIEPVPANSSRPSSTQSLFDLFHPVGTIYENASNPNNPATYMGMGRWVLWGKGMVTVGWNNDSSDGMFALNNNDLDVDGNPSHTAGGTLGTRTNTLTNANLPATKTDETVLISDPNGPIVVGGCQIDPDDTGPVYTKYREDQANTNATHLAPAPFDNIQPTITVYRWLRIE